MLSIQLHIATEQWNMTSVIEELKFQLHLISINLKSKQSKVAKGCRIGQYSLRHWIRTFDSVKPRSKTQTQYSVHLMWRADSLEKTLMLEKTEGRRKRTEDEMAGWYHWLSGSVSHEFEQALGDGDNREAWRAAVLGVAELDTTEQLSNNKDSGPFTLTSISSKTAMGGLETMYEKYYTERTVGYKPKLGADKN